MRVTVQSQARRVVIDLEEEGEATRLKVALGSKKGNTLLPNWEAAETVILGFIRKLRQDEGVGKKA